MSERPKIEERERERANKKDIERSARVRAHISLFNQMHSRVSAEQQHIKNFKLRNKRLKTEDTTANIKSINGKHTKKEDRTTNAL